MNEISGGGDGKYWVIKNYYIKYLTREVLSVVLWGLFSEDVFCFLVNIFEVNTFINSPPSYEWKQFSSRWPCLRGLFAEYDHWHAHSNICLIEDKFVNRWVILYYSGINIFFFVVRHNVQAWVQGRGKERSPLSLTRVEFFLLVLY